MIEKTDENALGIGSYGAVYKAKIGQLPCAAKILHPTLFQVGDPGSDRIRLLFEQECQVLRRIRHPHVIQYIKSFQDAESQLPILLMELLDESLTHYLERLHAAVPHHVQLNLGHDIALALEFLHSVGVIHRDLSSNNVLLIAGRRAKVTDFGMAKLWDGHTRMTPATFCPGTMVYMPPEALKSDPVYHEKLDCFSAGVVFLQILIREFPNPKDRVVHVNDPRYPSGIEVIVPEYERRRVHIEMAPQNHPLLLLALDCIRDESFLRPSAQEICSRIDALKGTSWHHFVSRQEEEAERRRGTAPQSEEAAAEEEDGEEEEVEGVGNGAVREMEQMENGVDDDERVAELERRLEEQVERVREEKEKELNGMQQQLKEKAKENARLRMEVEKMTDTLQERQQAIHDLRQDLEEAQEQVEERDQQVVKLERRMYECKVQSSSSSNRLMPPLPLEKPRTHSTSDLPSASYSPLTSPDSIQLQWRQYGTARKIDGDSATVSESTAYFADGNLVVMFNSVKEEWITLPHCPKRSFAVAIVSGLLTAIGGFKAGEGSVNTLLSLSSEGHGHTRKWYEEFPPMTFSHHCPAAVCTGHILVVAGGYGSEENGRCVEVLDTCTMCWSIGASLPFPLWRATAVACGDRIYIGGGIREGKPHGFPDVLYCSLSDLQSVHTTTSTSLKRLRNKLTHATRVWHSTAKLPVRLSTLVALQGHIFAIGGQNPEDNSPVSDVCVYSQTSNVWRPSDHMTQPRSKCFAVVLPGNRLMVLGGSIEPYTTTDSIEIASVV